MHATLSILMVLLAQAANPPLPADNAAKFEAQALLKEGTALFDQGDYVTALEKFERAYARFPSPNLQFNIGRANQSLGRPVEALAAFRQFLEGAPNAPADVRDDAQRAVADLHRKLGQVRVECSTQGAEVIFDGKPIGTTPLGHQIWAVPGPHQVVVRRSGFTPTLAQVDVVPGQVWAVTASLHQLAVPEGRSTVPRASSSSAEGPLLVTTTPSTTATKPLAPYRTAFWAGAWGTAALAVGALIAGLAADSQYSSLQNSCAPPKGVGCSESQIDTVKTRVSIRNTLWILSGTAAAATGVVLFAGSQEAGGSMSWAF
jgi:hypothetical protein